MTLTIAEEREERRVRALENIAKSLGKMADAYVAQYEEDNPR